MLWTLHDAATAAQGEIKENSDKTSISNVVHDSRSVKDGSLFITLKGPNHDAHNFLEEVFANGAAAALVSKEWWNATGQKDFAAHNFIVVEDTQTGLENLATAARERSNAKVVGITGSVGKTSTKEFLHTILSEQGTCHANERSFNNHWGVPLTLANLPQDADYAVIEMGINHIDEMEKLSAQAQPDVALITNIEPAHIGNFNSINDIAEEKSKIFMHMQDTITEGGIAILNADNPYTSLIEKRINDYGMGQVLTFGEEKTADARLKDCTLLSDSSKVTAKIRGQKYKYHLPVPGKHFVHNALSILLIVSVINGDMDKAIESMASLTQVEGRGNHIPVHLSGDDDTELTIIDESYNASPVSMNAALKVLEISEPAAEGRRIVVLGDMLELGAEGPSLHIGLVNPVLRAKTDLVYACGPLMEALYNIIPPEWQGGYAEDSKILAKMLVDEVRPGDVVLVKGSLGSRMAYVVQALQNLNTPRGKSGEAANTDTEKASTHAV